MSAEDQGVQTRVMLVDDHADFRRLMTDMVARQPDLEVVAQAGSLAEARNHAAAVKYDVVVLDLGLPDGNGVDLIEDVREFNAGVAVLILSASLHPTNLGRAREAGADEILDKLATPGEIVATIRRLGTGKAPA
ncbi:MAG TPA: response regulator transcription factor [Rubrobacteraceae bacterium]|nr:response regulator transcription factor [Rubrobacteraceae bacterium]